MTDSRADDTASERASEAICGALAKRGCVVAPGFIAQHEVTALRAGAQTRHAAGEFHAARVGRGANAQRDPALRGDEICWLEAAHATPPERALLARLDALRARLNRALFLGLVELEAHYACYAPGAGYSRHLDRFRDDDARVISLVLYLNEAWRDEDGGELHLFASADAFVPALAVAPRGGTLVALRSDTISHEVAPARRERWSIAAWLRRRASE